MSHYFYKYMISFRIQQTIITPKEVKLKTINNLSFYSIIDQAETLETFCKRIIKQLKVHLQKDGVFATIQTIVIHEQMVYSHTMEEIRYTVHEKNADLQEFMTAFNATVHDEENMDVDNKQYIVTDVKRTANEYHNPGNVVVMLVPTTKGLLLIQRGNKDEDGYEQYALPGGWQEDNETWQETAVREISEELNIDLDSHKINIFDIDTVKHPKTLNLVFGIYTDVVDAEKFVQNDTEVLDVKFINEPMETAFPKHTEQIKKYFANK